MYLFVNHLVQAKKWGNLNVLYYMQGNRHSEFNSVALC